MRKFRIHVKLIQEVTFEMDEEAYGDDPITAEDVVKMEEDNVKSDPTYFSFLDDSTEHVEVDVREIKDV